MSARLFRRGFGCAFDGSSVTRLLVTVTLLTFFVFFAYLFFFFYTVDALHYVFFRFYDLNFSYPVTCPSV